MFSIRMVMAKPGWVKSMASCRSVGCSREAPGGMTPWRMPGVPTEALEGPVARLTRSNPRRGFAQNKLLGFLFIDVMKWSSVFIVTPAEADQDFVPPRPHPMIGRPPAESTGFSIDSSVNDLRRLVGDADSPTM